MSASSCFAARFGTNYGEQARLLTELWSNDSHRWYLDESHRLPAEVAVTTVMSIGRAQNVAVVDHSHPRLTQGSWSSIEA